MQIVAQPRQRAKVDIYANYDTVAGQVRRPRRVAAKREKPRRKPQMQLRWASYNEVLLIRRVAKEKGHESAQKWIYSLVRAEVARAVEEGLV